MTPEVVPYWHEEGLRLNRGQGSAPRTLYLRLRRIVSLGTLVAVTVALITSLLYLAWIATIRSADQIAALSVGTFVVGLSCGFAAIMLTGSMIRAIRSARDGRALLAALLAGAFAIAAASAFAASNILGKLAA